MFLLCACSNNKDEKVINETETIVNTENVIKEKEITNKDELLKEIENLKQQNEALVKENEEYISKNTVKQEDVTVTLISKETEESYYGEDYINVVFSVKIIHLKQ